MATLNKFNSFTNEVMKGTHNFSTNALKAAFSNVAPVATNAVLADITQIAAGGGYSTGGIALTSALSTASGVAKLTITDKVFTASGAVATFRYIVLYNDTPTSPADPLIGWYDYGSAVTLANLETFTIDFDDTNGVLTVG